MIRARKAPTTAVYCGPSIKGLARQFTVFDRVPDRLAELAATKPIIGALLVPISDYAEARLQIGRGEGRYAALFAEAIKEVNNT